MVELTLQVPDKYVDIILDSFDVLAGKQLELSADGMDFNGRWSFQYDPKEHETNAQFAKRVIAEMVRAMVRLVDYAEDCERYSMEIAGVTPPTQDILDEVISG